MVSRSLGSVAGRGRVTVSRPCLRDRRLGVIAALAVEIAASTVEAMGEHRDAVEYVL